MSPMDLRRPDAPVFLAPSVVIGLAGVIVAAYLFLWFAGENWQIWSLYAFSFIPARIGGGMPFPAIPGSQAWSFLTYSFLHADVLHLVSNVVWIVVFGTVVARHLSAPKFLLLCAAASTGGAVGTLLAYWGSPGIMVGASGIVSGLVGAAIPLMYGVRLGPNTRRPLSPAELFSDRRALIFTAVWLAVTLFSGATGWTGNSFVEEIRIAWEAHIGGFVAGIAAFYLLDEPDTLQSRVS